MMFIWTANFQEMLFK